MLRILPVAALLGLAILVLSAANPEVRSSPDPDLYVSAGCAGCHGAAATGDIGPTLAGTRLTFDAFLEQLRSPRAWMPVVSPSLVSDTQARDLFEYVAGLEVPEDGPIAGSGCPGGRHGQGHHGAGAGQCPHHGQGSAHQGQGRGRGGACRHGACRREAQASS